MGRSLFRTVGAMCFVLGLALLGARSAWAGPTAELLLEKHESGGRSHLLRVEVNQFPANGRSGALGFASLLFHNPHATPRSVSARFEVRGGFMDQSWERALTLEPESVTRIHCPIPGIGWGNLKVTGPGGYRASTHISANMRADRFAVLGVQAAARTPRHTAWTEATDAATALLKSKHPADAGTPEWCDSETVPSDWRLLSGFDLILLNAGVADFDAAQQDALARYVAGGGHLVLTGIKETPEGPLGRMMTSLGEAHRDLAGRHGRHGFGRWLALTAQHPKDAPGLVRWIAHEAFDGRRSVVPIFAGGIPTVFREPLEIPGLGKVPVQLFFLFLLAFAVFVGPLTYVWLRRRRRLPWLTVTIPVTGFLVSAAILLYGFFSEGFGIRGSIRSFTVLDQETHEAATSSGRTLFAGLSPSALVPAPGTFVAPPYRDDTGGRGAREVDLGAGWRMAGSALPSRTPTTFSTMSVGRARERLRFRRREDGTFDVLHGPEFAPVVAAGAVLLRTFDGDLFRSDGSGRLLPHPMEGAEVPTRPKGEVLDPLASLPLGLGQVPAMPGRSTYYGHYSHYGARGSITNEGAHGFRRYFDEDWGGRLEKGTYLARVKGLPSLDEFGLTVDYEKAEHLVYGLLAPEDIVE